jgi:hypothetical protein
MASINARRVLDPLLLIRKGVLEEVRKKSAALVARRADESAGESA